MCGRQDNIMPNSPLSDALEDINCELMKRVDSNASSHQPSPKTTRRLASLSGSQLSQEDFKLTTPSSPSITPYEFSFEIDETINFYFHYLEMMLKQIFVFVKSV